MPALIRMLAGIALLCGIASTPLPSSAQERQPVRGRSTRPENSSLGWSNKRAQRKFGRTLASSGGVRRAHVS